tara:strand:- start:2747 stop:3004 length:258 start_codon:yes stop_codon:yes gene_type:complete
MSITDLQREIDHIAGKINSNKDLYGTSRETLTKMWYEKVKKIASRITAHSTFLKKSSERKLKIKKSALNRLKEKNLNKSLKLNDK